VPQRKAATPAQRAERLRRENAALRRRLAEAEQTLEAIRSGAVDALVVSGPEGEQVFTLQGAERPYRVLLEALHAGALTLNPEGIILYANRDLAEMLALPLEEVLGQPLAAFAVPEDRPRLHGMLAESTHRPAVGELRLRRPAREPVPVHLAVRRIVSSDLQAICVAVTDLTEQKRVEDQIRRMNATLEARVRERTATLEAIFAGSPVALSLTSLTTGCHLEVNEAWVRLFGYSRTEAVGRTVAELGTWKHPEVRESLLGGLETEGGITAHEVELVTKSGIAFPALLSWHPFQLAGEPVVVAAIVDLTEAKRRERELRAALAQEKDALATNRTLLREVHHRVKNNLQMLCDLLYLQMEAVTDGEKAGALQDTYGRIYAIARLHEELYQAMQSGQIRLPAYLGRVIAGFESLYPAVRVTLDAAETDLALDVDRAIHVGLIANELVTNALKHAFPGRPGGRIAVRLQRAGDQLALEVRDDGIGLPSDLDLARVKTLGLRIVRILASRLEAALVVENRNGTHVRITFPLRAAPLVEPQR